LILHASHTLKVAPAAHTEHQAILSDAALSFVEELVKTFGASVEKLPRARAALEQ
jgi:malate synthase